MKKVCLVVLAAAVLSGCATSTPKKQAVDPSLGAELRNQSVTRVLRPAPDFVAMTAGKAALGLIGTVASISAGNSLVAEHGIEDPARTIAAGLLKAVEARHGMQVVAPSAPITERGPEALAAASNGARYLVDVQTLLWSFNYFPTDWTHYRVMHVATARLIDTKTMKVVSAGTCKHIPPNNDNAPSYDQLLGQNAALLKKTMADIADACIATLEKDLLPS